MNSIDKTGTGIQRTATLEEVKSKLASNPGRCALFLGTGISVESGEDRRRALTDLARQACGAAPDSPVARKVLEAVQANDFMGLSDVLFGKTWDDSSFLNADRERNIKLRNAYKERLPGKDKIGRDKIGRDEINAQEAREHQYLEELIGRFRGVILTTCQDDTVEAIWEYKNSLPTDTMVYTPQLIVNSNDWSRRLHAAEDEAAYLKSQSESPEDSVVVAKLFGTRDKPTKMLLSKQDIEGFYPSKKDWEDSGRPDGNRINTIRFLERIFDSYTILFVKVDLENDWLLGAAAGILELLKKKPQAGRERYAFQCKGFNSELYHVQTVDGGWNASGADSLLKQISRSQAADGDVQAVEIDENAPLEDPEKILGVFWLFYNRRPRKLFLPEKKPAGEEAAYNAHAMEYRALQRDVLGFEPRGGVNRVWTRKNIRQLAIAANNFSDFYDLRDALNLARTEKGEPYEETVKTLLSSRFSEKSLLLYRILQCYESGFPIGFLQLLPEEKYTLKEWKRAAIQLANSGVYVQRHEKQRLYERLRYADHVMRTAGSGPLQERICSEIDAMGCQSMYSYFYPFCKVEIEKGKEIEDEKINANFTEMFRELYDILQDKSEKYQQIHSLLQTELPAVARMMRGLRDENLEWKPGLLYYLLRESRVCVEGEELLAYCDKLEQELGKRQDSGEPRWRLFCAKLMLYQAKALIMSQSSGMKKQQAAADECWKVEKEICDAQKEHKFWSGVAPSCVFEHRINACFLRSTIFGQMSSIREIERCGDSCRDKTLKRAEQASLLEKMKDSLGDAKEIIKEREDVLEEPLERLRNELERLRGKYYFKMSQYHAENRRYSKTEEQQEEEWQEEKDCYQRSERAYEDVLRYYRRNPDHYWVQCADTMRNIADMYCQWTRSAKERAAKGRPGGEDRWKLAQRCCDNLIEAYILYRRHSDLHGIADVLQSMGQVEEYVYNGETAQAHGAWLRYYKASEDLYLHLGDTWSAHVVSGFARGRTLYGLPQTGKAR